MTPPHHHGVPSPGLETLSLDEADRQVARYRWLERRRFELLGGWVASADELEVKQVLARHAHHHAWHATLWDEHLPHRSGYRAPADDPGSGGLASCVQALAETDGYESSIERLAGAYRVVAARAVGAYTALLARTSVVSDGALARTCRLVLADQLDDWREGEALLQSLLDSDGRIERAAARQAELEKLVLAGEGCLPD